MSAGTSDLPTSSWHVVDDALHAELEAGTISVNAARRLRGILLRREATIANLTDQRRGPGQIVRTAWSDAQGITGPGDPAIVAGAAARASLDSFVVDL